MGCLYLHAGTPKTGTSSIQYFLGKNRKLLTEQGYCFPVMPHFDKIGQNRNAHFLIHRYFDENNERLLEKEEQMRARAMEKLLSRLEQYDNVVLSDESLWNHSYYFKDFWKNLSQRITEKGHTIKVIVYLRRQDTYLQSYWAQNVKSGAQKLSFADYLNKKPWKQIHANYLQALDLIASAVGEENIIVRPFESGQFLDSSLYADFLHCIGLSLTEEYHYSDQSKNDTVFGEYIQIKQILNENPKFAEKKGFMTDLIYAATLQHGEKPDYQRAAVFPEGPANFLKQFQQGNEEIARKYLHREDGILFYNMPSDNNTIDSYSAEELVHACGDIILELKNELDEVTEETKRANQSLKMTLRNAVFLSKQRIRRLLQRKKK